MSSRARGRLALGRVLLVATSLVVALVGAELVYRAQRIDAPMPGDDDDGWYARYRRMNETLYRRSEDPALVYEPVPGASVEMEYGTAAFNEGGLREDREVALAPGDAQRVAVVGDSIVWGEFLPAREAPAQQIGRALGDGFEVLNFGVSGYDTAQEAAYYARTVRAHRPAIVVVVFCLNDFLIMSGPFERFARDEERAAKDLQEAWLARVAPVRRETIEDLAAARERDAVWKVFAHATGLFERWRFEGDYVDELLLGYRDDARRTRTTDAITELGRAIEADGARALFVISPVLESWDDYHWDEIHRHVAAAAASAGFEVVDLYETWRDDEDPATMRVDTLHYDPSGSARFGETVADAVRTAGR